MLTKPIWSFALKSEAQESTLLCFVAAFFKENNPTVFSFCNIYIILSMMEVPIKEFKLVFIVYSSNMTTKSFVD